MMILKTMKKMSESGVTNSILFCLARKVSKEHTVIQERYVPLGTTASGTALGIGSRGFIGE
jgi:hypothetical protein